jgi:hypothetical protein
MVWLVIVARLPTVNVILEVPDPGAAMLLGLKETLLLLPCPEADKLTAELKPPVIVVVIVTVPDDLLATVIELGDAETLRPAVTPDVTVSETVVVCVTPPPVPVMVMLYVPAATVDATVNVAVEVPDPGAAIDDGLKPTVTPLGMPDAVSATAASNPFDTVEVIVNDPLLPAATEIAEGEADNVNDGFCVDDPVSAAINPEFGLPQPVTRSYPDTAEKLPEVPLVMSWKSAL